MADHRAVLDFWFAEGMKDRWFKKDEAFDSEVEEKLGALYEQAAAGALDHWQNDFEGCLALIVLLDQVPRNLFRGQAKAFATDEKALGLTYRMLERGWDRGLPQLQRVFVYMPLEHCETLEGQELCLELMGELKDAEEWLKYVKMHHDIIARFGRFPHRNEALGRETTEEEAEFLKGPNSSF
ncbi:MAG: DUF924 family protein [Kiloniellales bacterium]|nr:DUF924 family protein [Kiloniellales bacterium]